MLYYQHMKSYKTLKRQLLKHKSIRREYEKLETESMLAKLVIEKRLAKGLTQTDLARKIGTKQSAIARLESGNYNPSLIFMRKVANALNSELTVTLS